jgi:hypothetical protein
MGLRLLSRSTRAPFEGLGAKLAPLLQGCSRHAAAVLVRSQQRVDDQMRQARCHTWLAQLRMGARQVVREGK